MTDVVNPKGASPDQLLPYHKKISAEGKALIICFISYTYMVLKRAAEFSVTKNSAALKMPVQSCRLRCRLYGKEDKPFLGACPLDFRSAQAVSPVFLCQFVFAAKSRMPATPHGYWVSCVFLIPCTNNLCSSIAGGVKIKQKSLVSNKCWHGTYIWELLLQVFA